MLCGPATPRRVRETDDRVPAARRARAPPSAPRAPHAPARRTRTRHDHTRHLARHMTPLLGKHVPLLGQRILQLALLVAREVLEVGSLCEYPLSAWDPKFLRRDLGPSARRPRPRVAAAANHLRSSRDACGRSTTSWARSDKRWSDRRRAPDDLCCWRAAGALEPARHAR